MRSLLISFGLALTFIFGGVFFYHLICESEFLVGDLIRALIGLAILLYMYVKQKRLNQNQS